jgi:sulfur-oxidizing protein SoxZ
MDKRLHIKVPRKAKKGEIVRLMTKLNHPMESGWRRRQSGEFVPRELINEFVCQFDGKEVFTAELGSGAAGNPYLSFYIRVQKSGTVRFTWRSETGEIYMNEAAIEVV